MKLVTRKLWVLAFVTAWTVAPAFPSIVCAMTLPSAEQSALAETPDCHQAAKSSTAGGQPSRTHRGCCEDAATSCCLRALDVHGAVGSVLTLDSSATAIVVAAPQPPASLPPSLPVVTSQARAHSPPGSYFQVLRL